MLGAGAEADEAGGKTLELGHLAAVATEHSGVPKRRVGNLQLMRSVWDPLRVQSVPSETRTPSAMASYTLVVFP